MKNQRQIITDNIASILESTDQVTTTKNQDQLESDRPLKQGYPEEVRVIASREVSKRVQILPKRASSNIINIHFPDRYLRQKRTNSELRKSQSPSKSPQSKDGFLKNEGQDQMRSTLGNTFNDHFLGSQIRHRDHPLFQVNISRNIVADNTLPEKQTVLKKIGKYYYNKPEEADVLDTILQHSLLNISHSPAKMVSKTQRLQNYNKTMKNFRENESTQQNTYHWQSSATIGTRNGFMKQNNISQFSQESSRNQSQMGARTQWSQKNIAVDPYTNGYFNLKQPLPIKEQYKTQSQFSNLMGQDFSFKGDSLSYQRKLQKAQLNDVLSKRDKFNKTSSNNKNCSNLASKLLNQSFSIQNAPIAFLDPSLARAGAQAIVQELSGEQNLSSSQLSFEKGLYKLHRNVKDNTPSNRAQIISQEKRIMRAYENCYQKIVDEMPDIIQEPQLESYESQSILIEEEPISKYIEDVTQDIRSGTLKKKYAEIFREVHPRKIPTSKLNLPKSVEKVSPTKVQKLFEQSFKKDIYNHIEALKKEWGLFGSKKQKIQRQPLYDYVKKYYQRFDNLSQEYEKVRVKNPLDSNITKGVKNEVKQNQEEIIKTKKKIQYKKFNLISHLIKELEQIRSEHDETPNEKLEQSSRVSDNTNELYENESDEMPLSKNQILQQRNSKLDVAKEKTRHRYQILENQELRKFINDHEALVDRAFEIIMKDLGNKNEEAITGKKKEVVPPSRIVDAKEMYSKWLRKFYNEEEQHISSSVEKIKNEKKQKEYIQTYLMKRLGKMASSTGRLPQKSPVKEEVNSKYLSHHYGAWYLKPKNFNDSMLAHKNKMTKNQILNQEKNEEIQQIQFAENYLKN